MGLFGKLFSRDPTADWAPHDGRLPTIDPSTGKFGPIRFGDPLEGARALGRPRIFEGEENHAALKYASGVVLEFEFGKFVNLCFNTAESLAELNDTKPAVGNIGGLPISEATKMADAIAWLGEPDEREEDDDGEYVGLTYKRGKITLYFEFATEGRLVFVDITTDD